MLKERPPREVPKFPSFIILTRFVKRPDINKSTDDVRAETQVSPRLTGLRSGMGHSPDASLVHKGSTLHPATALIVSEEGDPALAMAFNHQKASVPCLLGRLHVKARTAADSGCLYLPLRDLPATRDFSLERTEPIVTYRLRGSFGENLHRLFLQLERDGSELSIHGQRLARCYTYAASESKKFPTPQLEVFATSSPTERQGMQRVTVRDENTAFYRLRRQRWIKTPVDSSITLSIDAILRRFACCTSSSLSVRSPRPTLHALTCCPASDGSTSDSLLPARCFDVPFLPSLVRPAPRIMLFQPRCRLPLDRYDGFAAHVVSRIQRVLARLDVASCHASTSMPFPLSVTVGYSKGNGEPK
ncbi:hypothetical protein R1flu_004782 [Riccia fluitans]|uniref:Uncharacterized protein n=1 Tax=Riccia fluitans TaxID=41844 RepID=A0ABD1YRA0_9MARC